MISASGKAPLFRLSFPLALLLLAAGLLVGTVSQRGAEYDEQYTRLLIAGTPRPVIPSAAAAPTIGNQTQPERGIAAIASLPPISGACTSRSYSYINRAC